MGGKGAEKARFVGGSGWNAACSSGRGVRVATTDWGQGLVEGSLALDTKASRAVPLPREIVDLIDGLPLPAYLCTAYGVVLHENPTARAAHPKPPPWLVPTCRFRRSSERHSVRGLVIGGRRCLFVVDCAGLERARAERETVSDFKLPPRMAELARHLAEGLSDSEIAAETGLTYRTVRTYVRRLYARLGVHSRAQLIRRVLAIPG